MKNFLLKTTALSLFLPLASPSLKAGNPVSSVSTTSKLNAAAPTPPAAPVIVKAAPVPGLHKFKEMSPSLRISGETSFNMYGVSQDENKTNGGKQGGPYFGLDDSRINFSIFGKTEKMGRLEYSALISLSGNPASADVQENRLKLKGEWGNLMGGNTRGVDDFMAFGAFAVMGGTGGFAGNFTSVLNPSTGALVTTDLAGRPKDATKIIYVTPRVNGVQGGISFTPSTVQKGDQKLATIAPSAAKSLPFDRNQVALGLNYQETFLNGLEVKLSFTSLIGQTKPPVAFPADKFSPQYKDTRSYAVGGIIGYKDFEIGAEFIDNGSSQTALNGFNADGSYPIKGADAGKAGSIAVSYKMGANKASLGYYTSSKCLRSDYENAKTNIISVAFDHKIAPGLSIAAEGNFVDMKTDSRAVADQDAYKAKASDLGLSKHDLSDGVGSNTAQVFILSTKLKF